MVFRALGNPHSGKVFEGEPEARLEILRRVARNRLDGTLSFVNSLTRGTGPQTISKTVLGPLIRKPIPPIITTSEALSILATWPDTISIMTESNPVLNASIYSTRNTVIR